MIYRSAITYVTCDEKDCPAFIRNIHDGLVTMDEVYGYIEKEGWKHYDVDGQMETYCWYHNQKRDISGTHQEGVEHE